MRKGIATNRYARAKLDHARQCASGERIAAHGYGRAWDAGLGMLGDATAQTATRWLSEAMHGEGVVQQSRGATIVRNQDRKDRT